MQALISTTERNDGAIPLGKEMRDLTIPEQVRLGFNGTNFGLGSVSSRGGLKSQN